MFTIFQHSRYLKHCSHWLHFKFWKFDQGQFYSCNLFWFPVEGSHRRRKYMCPLTTQVSWTNCFFFSVSVFIFRRTSSNSVHSTCFLPRLFPKLINGSKVALWGLFSSSLNPFLIRGSVWLLMRHLSWVFCVPLLVHMPCTICSSLYLNQYTKYLFSKE